MIPSSFVKNALIFAPLEGYSDVFFRTLLVKNFPDWSAFCCEFYRLSRNAPKNSQSLRAHFGESFLSDPKLKEKIIFQILTSKDDAIEAYCERLSEIKIPWLDLNAGCPMKRIVAHKGGSYLLSEMTDLKTIVSRIRKSYDSFFSVKIRI